MTKENFFNVIFGLLVVALAFSVLSPESETSFLISASLAIVLVLALLSLGAERATELIKIVLRFVFGRVPFLRSWQPSGVGSALLALIVSYAGIRGFDVNIFKEFEPFAKLDPELISYITIGLSWLFSSVWHNFFPPDVAKAQEIK